MREILLPTAVSCAAPARVMTALPILTLSMNDLLHPFETVLSLHMPIEATGKRKVDGSKAASRLGSSATEKWEPTIVSQRPVGDGGVVA